MIPFFGAMNTRMDFYYKKILAQAQKSASDVISILKFAAVSSD